MTLFAPTLQVRRLVIHSHSGKVFDEQFHNGVNVIRGENSSGKSTLLNLLFYGLGGDYVNWSDVALKCSQVYVEVAINGHLATLCRPVRKEGRQAMQIIGGDFDQAVVSPQSQWTQYPYARTENKESFSQAMFRLLGIPEFTSDSTGSVTLHQMLRVLYADQLSPIENIFRHERFDTAALRDAIGRLLCGAYDTEVYENHVLLKSLEKEFDSVSGELRSLYSVIGDIGDDLSLKWISAQREKIIEEIGASKRQLDGFREGCEAEDGAVSLEETNSLYKRLSEAQTNLTNIRKDRKSLELEVADSSSFIRHLQNKIRSLQQASAAQKAFGSIEFVYCPSCLAPIAEIAPHQCHLCKEPSEKEKGVDRFVHMVNEASIQLKQSEEIQKSRSQLLEKMLSEEELAFNLWKRLASLYEDTRRSPSTVQEQKISELNRRIGYLEREIESLDRRAKIVARLEMLSSRKEQINAHIGKLKARNHSLMEAQEQKFDSARRRISYHLAQCLRNDLRRQDAFEDPKEIWFDFGGDRITVDKQEYFSASSRVILKNSFFISFLISALEDSAFRHPRLCILDTVEEHGVEPIRSHNFQNLIVKMLAPHSTEHQIIFATANICPDLDDDAYTVGRYYTRDEPTLLFDDR